MGWTGIHQILKFFFNGRAVRSDSHAVFLRHIRRQTLLYLLRRIGVQKVIYQCDGQSLFVNHLPASFRMSDGDEHLPVSFYLVNPRYTPGDDPFLLKSEHCDLLKESRHEAAPGLQSFQTTLPEPP